MHIVMLEPIGISEENTHKLSTLLVQQGHTLEPYFTKSNDVDELKIRVKDADILIIANMPLKGEVIKAADKLKMISVAFTGTDHIDMEACREKNIMVCNTAGYSTNSVAELTFGFIISLLRNIVPLDKLTRNSGTKTGFSQNELFGKTIGIVGTGAIGMRTAEIALAFGMKVLAYSRTRKQECIDKNISYVDLDELLKQSDIVSLHVPLTAETKHLINKERIALMKSNAVLINTARGPVVDSEALAEALKEGTIAGAALDVFEVEPPVPSNHPVFSAPNVVVTPHIAFATEEAILRRAQMVFDNISLWLEGKPQNVIK